MSNANDRDGLAEVPNPPLSFDAWTAVRETPDYKVSVRATPDGVQLMIEDQPMGGWFASASYRHKTHPTLSPVGEGSEGGEER